MHQNRVSDGKSGGRGPSRQLICDTVNEGIWYNSTGSLSVLEALHSSTGQCWAFDFSCKTTALASFRILKFVLNEVYQAHLHKKSSCCSHCCEEEGCVFIFQFLCTGCDETRKCDEECVQRLTCTYILVHMCFFCTCNVCNPRPRRLCGWDGAGHSKPDDGTRIGRAPGCCHRDHCAGGKLVSGRAEDAVLMMTSYN